MLNDVEKIQQELAHKVIERFDAGDLAAALALAQPLTGQYPQFALGWYLTSALLYRLGRFSEAGNAIDRALALQNTGKHQLHKARCLLADGQREAALNLANRLLSARFPAASLHHEFGNLLNELNVVDQALAQFERAIAMDPRPAAFYFNKASMQRYLGDIDGAHASYTEVLRRSPLDFEAYFSRSGLRTQTPAQNAIAELEQVIKRAESLGQNRQQLHFLYYALAKEYEDIENHAAAAQALVKANRNKRAFMQYQVHTDVAIIEKIAEVFHGGLFDRPVQGYEQAAPVFVLGMPRTGTTLVERMLSCHSAIASAGELNDFAMALMAEIKESGARPKDRLALIEASAKLNFSALGRRYMASAAQHCPGVVHFIDKLPFNYLYVGLIRLALPNAKIINLQRHPLDTCLAVYKQYFKDAYPFSYDLQELGSYFLAYEKLMAHWFRVVPDGLLKVNYEAIVANPEQQARRLIAHCGLDWQPACLDFHTSERPSKTASATQVRQPVYATSVGKWRHYESLLQPVLQLFDQAGFDWQRDPTQC